MNVALHRCHRDGVRPHAVVGRIAHARLDRIESHLHRLGRGHQLRKEELAFVELLPHHIERGNEHAVDQVERVVTLQQRLGGRSHRTLSARQDEMHHVTHGIGGIRKRIRHLHRAFCGRISSPRRLRRLRGARGSARSRRACRIRVRGIGVFPDEPDSTGILAVQHPERVHRIGVAFRLRVQNGHIQPAPERGGQKRRVHHVALRQAEADVGHAERRAHTQALLHHVHGAQDLKRLRLIGRARHGQAVDDHIGSRDAVTFGSFHDPLGNGETPLGGGRDALIVKGKADHGAPIAFHDGKHGFQALPLSVDAVDKRLARVTAHRRLHRHRIGRVHHQRQRNRGREFVHRGGQHSRLVKLGKAHVDIEHVGAQLLLGNSLPHQVIQVTRTQRRLKLRLARGVDTLADHGDAGHAHRKHHGLLSAAQHASGIVGARRRHATGISHTTKLARVFRRRAAAPADDRGARIEHALHRGGEILGRHVEHGNPVLHARQARVRLHHQRATRTTRHILRGTQQLRRTKRAVQAHGMRAHARQHLSGHLGRRA